MTPPKRFPDRDEIAVVRAEAAGLEPETECPRKAAARREGHGEAGSREAQLPRPGRPLWAHSASVRREPGRGTSRRRARRRRGRRGLAGQLARGEPSLAVDELTVSENRSPLPDTFTASPTQETRYRRRYLDLLMSEDSRELFLLQGARRLVDPAAPRGRGRLRGGRDFLSSSRAMAGRSPTRSSRVREGLDADLYLRIATELYFKRLIVGGLERVYEIGKDFRNESVSYKHQPEFTMLEWYEAYADYPGHDGADREPETRAGRPRRARDHRGHVPGRGDRARQALAASSASSTALEELELWTRESEGELRAWLEGTRGRHGGGQGRASARRSRDQPLRRARPRPAHDRSRLPDRAVAVRPG